MGIKNVVVIVDDFSSSYLQLWTPVIILKPMGLWRDNEANLIATDAAMEMSHLTSVWSLIT